MTELHRTAHGGVLMHERGTAAPCDPESQTREEAPDIAEELQTEIRRGERLLEHYRKTHQDVCATMITRDLDRAKLAAGVGNRIWMERAVTALGTYEL